MWSFFAIVSLGLIRFPEHPGRPDRRASRRVGGVFRGVTPLIVAWHSTENLTLDRDGILWHTMRAEDGRSARPRRLGPIDQIRDPPTLLEVEYRECLDLWLDGFDDRAEQLWNYDNRR